MIILWRIRQIFRKILLNPMRNSQPRACGRFLSNEFSNKLFNHDQYRESMVDTYGCRIFFHVKKKQAQNHQSEAECHSSHVILIISNIFECEYLQVYFLLTRISSAPWRIIHLFGLCFEKNVTCNHRLFIGLTLKHFQRQRI